MIRLKPSSNYSAAGLDTTSLADIIFLLLLFYILTSTFVSTQGLMLKLPDSKGRENSSASKFLDIVVDSSGSVFIDGQMIPNEELSQSFHSAVLGNDPVEPLRARIFGDRKNYFQIIVKVLDALKSSGVKDILIVTSGVRETASPKAGDEYD